MLAGIYYGAQYGGSTTAILVNIPGESSSVVTTLDGYQMARRGRAGPALGIAAIGSFFAGCVATRDDRAVRAAARRGRAEIRPGGIFLADGVRPRRRDRARARLAHQGARHGLRRAAVRHDRHRRQFRRHPLRLRPVGARRRRRLRRARHGVLRHDRRRAQPRKSRAQERVREPHRQRAAEPCRPAHRASGR